MTDAIRRIARAADFAARRHVGQERKGARGEPYINHLAEVASLVADSGADGDVVAAAYLHDVVEDGHARQQEIVEAFGSHVAGLVEELTDDMTLAKDERRRWQVEHAPGLSPDAKRIKLADKASNLREMAEDPPEDWTVENRRAYAQWGRDVVDAGLRGVDANLEAAFDLAYDAVLRGLKS